MECNVKTISHYDHPNHHHCPGHQHNLLYFYNLFHQTWHEAGNLAVARHNHGAVAVPLGAVVCA